MNKNQELAWLLTEKFHDEKSVAFFADCERLESGEPLAYIIGSIPFLDCIIYLDSKPLIPRPETEFWVEKAITAIKSAQGSPRQGLGEPWAEVRVLDLCAGSGAIGIAIAKAIPGVHVTFAEIDGAHLTTIKKNIQTNLTHHAIEIPSINRRYFQAATQEIPQEPFIQMEGFGGVIFDLVESDLFESIAKEEKFNYILSNPPYIDAAAHTVEESVTTHEPHLALFGGVSGMEIIARIIEGARAKLAPHGQLWLEHEPFQTEAIAALANAHGFSVQTHPDQYDTLRYSILTFAVPK